MAADFSKTGSFVAKKHNMAILKYLIDAPHGVGFNAIQKHVSGSTPRILSTRLKELEKMKLIQKNLVLGDKPKIEYRATQKALGLKKPLAELEKWGQKELP